MIIPFSNKQNDVFLSSQLVSLKAQVLEDILVSKPLKDVLKHLCLSTEKLVKDGVASIKMLSERREYLTVFVAPSLSKAVLDALNGTSLDVGNGSCASAIINEEPTFVSDVAIDERWNNSRHVSEKFGIGASWSCPVYKNGDVIGTFEISSFEKREPSELQKQLLETAASLVGMAIEKTEAGNHRNCSETAFNHSAVGVVVADNDGMIFRSNGSFSQMTGIAIEKLIDVDMFSLLFSEAAQHRVTKQTLSENKFWHGEVCLHCASGETFPALVYINAVMSERGDIEQYVVEVSDISLLKASQERLKHIAHHDLLTNLPNRFSFESHLKESLKNKTKKALLLLDIDDFKTINENEGHSVGDILLKQVAIRLLECMRSDDLVARFGGDEFVALLTYNEGKDLKVLASRINQTLSQPYLINGRKYFSSVSIGVALIPKDTYAVNGIVKLAESAMRKAKDSGKNQYCFYTKSLMQVLKAKKVKGVDLRSAVENKELYIVYQPKFDATQNVVGVEALLRWQSSEHDFVLPSEFIPMAEESGFIVELGLWSLMTACQQVKSWHQQGKRIYLSLNISGSQLTKTFVDELSIILNEVEFDPKFLELEIAESVFLAVAKENKTILNRINDLGVRISIDDFGTGYSSASVLKTLPVHTLKIDQSLVRNLPGEKNDQAITKAIIEMGRELGVNVAVEGVETEEQLAFLREAGCDFFQGYLLGKPVPYDRFLSFLEDHSEQSAHVEHSKHKH